MPKCGKQLIIFLFLMFLFSFNHSAVPQPVEQVFACVVAAVLSGTKESRV